MTLRERLRQIATAMPPGATVSFPREWLLQELDAQATGTSSADLTDLTAQQVADEFGKKAGTVAKWAAAGEFSGAYRVHGREWRIPRAAVEAFKAKQRADDDTDSADLSRWRDAHDRAG